MILCWLLLNCDHQLELATQTRINQIWYQTIATKHFSLQAIIKSLYTNAKHIDGRVCLPRFDVFYGD